MHPIKDDPAEKLRQQGANDLNGLPADVAGISREVDADLGFVEAHLQGRSSNARA